MKKITVYCEIDYVSKKLTDVSYELISKAHNLAAKAKELKIDESYSVEAVALLNDINQESIKKAFMAGADNFVLIKDRCLETFCQTICSQCFVEYFKQFPSEVIIFPATSRGRMVAPRITTILNTGLVADCTGLDFILKENRILFAPTRPTFGSELMATILSKSYPQCATVRPKIFQAEFNQSPDGNFFEFKPTSLEETRIKIINSFLDNSSNISDLSCAKIILCAGWGISQGKDAKYFIRLEQVAKALGAKVASTRKVVDRGLMPQMTQIGQTGATVSADLYISFGVSGAIQHVMGMKNCKTIIAINTDENADIFKYADYKIIADAKTIIDELYEKLCT